jgi:hypothetical protein
VIRTAIAIVSVMLLIAAAVMYLPALGWSNDETAARERAAAYLRAVSGGAEDRGWSLLMNPSSGRFGSEVDYRRAMAEADWSRFEWELRGWARCDDGVCTLELQLPNGWRSVPRVMRQELQGDPGPIRNAADNAWAPRPTDDVLIDVLQRGWFGGIGVAIPGG